jgi:amino acid adenylation domain-containing protein
VLVTQLPSLERNPAINPVFQTFFTLTQDNIDTGLQLAQIKSEYVPADIEGTKFDISLNMRQLGDKLECHFEYNRDLFRPETISQMASNFIHLGRLLCSNDKDNIDTLVFMDTALYQQQINTDEGWNATQYAYPHCHALHSLIEQQCQITPHNTAVSDEQQSLSYHQLNTQSNQLAHYLISKGIQRNQPVAVCMERSVSMSIALLAILKAGGAYVPIATDLPAERIRYICNDINTPFLLCSEQSPLNHLELPLLPINDKHLWQNCAENNPAVPHQPDDLFNIIYTSGSTGKPKGVMVPHQGIINRLRWMQHEYKLTPDDIVLQKTPYNFDVSVWELFWPLICGARLHFARPDGHKDADYLRNCIINNNITILHFVPSMLGLFLQTQHIEQCTQLRLVFTSGEALQIEQAERFFEQLPQAELHNLYGPTEASIDVSYFQCRPHEKRRSIPIGKPIHNIQLHILDKHLQPLPTGATGELYIGGIGLALGYWNQETLTEQCFINNPFYAQGHPSKKLYKTGDIARYLPDGNIEYLGRNDHQVKIRGFRIEPGEIESQCRKLPDINDALVIHRNHNHQAQLIAYLVTQSPLLETAEYHRMLKQHIPEYMLPTAYVAIHALPLSANGKIDRKQLPDVDLGNLKQHQYVAPRNAIEEMLATFWQELLHIQHVGIYDNFFELGGHSLLAAQLITRVRDQFQIELPLRTLFEVNTIEGLAKIISALSFAADTASLTGEDEFEEGLL